MSQRLKPIEIDLGEAVLEEPQSAEPSETLGGGLFQDDLGILSTKMVALEAMFKLLTSNLSFQDFTREALLILMRAVRSEAGSILEMNYEDNTIFFRTAAGHTSDKIVRFVIPMGQGIVGHVAESKQPLVVGDAEGNEYHLKALAKAVGFEVRNMVALPILIRGKVFAVLELLNRVGDDTYSAADIELLTSLCDFMAKAIEVRLMLASRRTPPSQGGRYD